MKEPKYDLRAGRQIFDKFYTREDKRFATVRKDTENPIDVRLRQLCFLAIDGKINIKAEFYDKWAVILWGQGESQLKYIIGRIKDVYVATRDIYIKTRKDDIYIVPFDRVIEVSEHEPA